MTELDRAWPILEPAIARALHVITKDDVAQGIRDGSFKLVTTDESAVVLEISDRGGRKLLNFFLAAGVLSEIQDIVAFYEQWAQGEGFDAVTIIGRRGWGKALCGYKEQSVLYEKRLKD